MLIVKETAPNIFDEILPGSSFLGSDGTRHGWQVAELWTDAELNDIGVHRVSPAPISADPEAMIAGYHFERVEGVISQVLEVVQPTAPTMLQLQAYAAARRFEIEVGGIVSGTFGPLASDRDTRSIIGQTIQSIDLGIIAAPVNFKTSSGFIPLDRAAFMGIATELAAHVQSTFDREGQAEALILAGEITTKAQVDAALLAG